jgi:alcohol dehydrogenase class IV
MYDSLNISDTFIFQLPRKIIFGNGAITKVGEEARSIFAGKNVLMITDKGIIKAGLTQDAVSSLEKNSFEVSVFDGVLPDAPLSTVIECTELAKKKEADIIFGIGGGSSIDTAKAVSVLVTYEGKIYDCLGINKVKKPGLPKIFVPTTAGTGSELSHTFILTDDLKSGDKLTSYSPYTFSDLSIIDPTLTRNLPKKITAESGMDAFSHALESYVTARANPLSDLFSLRGIEIISKSLRKAYAKGSQSPDARYAMCFGICMGTMAIRSSGVGAVHATCYPPAMKYNLTHGLAISIMLPYVMEYNLIGNLEKFATIATAMGENIAGLSMRDAGYLAVKAVKKLIKDVGLPLRLRDVGAKKEDFFKFAKTVVMRYSHHLSNNPRDLDEKDIIKIYELAY